MFSPLGAISALGSGAMSGLETGADLYDKYTSLQGQALLAQALGMPTQGPQPPFPGDPSQPPPQAAPGPPQGPGALPGIQPMGGPMTGGGPPPSAMAFDAPGSPRGAFAMMGTGGQIPQAALQPPMTRPPPPQAPRPPLDLAPPAPGPVGTPEQVRRFAQTGEGWLSLPDLARRIEQSNPDASPMVKFKALQAGAKLLSASGQSQFMQVQQYMQRERFHQDTLERQRLQEERAGRKEELGIEKERRQSPYVFSQRRAMSQLIQNEETKRVRAETTAAQMDRLKDLSEQLRLTGVVPIDTFIANLRAKFGEATAVQWKTQLEVLRSDIGALLAQSPSGVMSEGMRKEVQGFVNGVLGPKALEGIKKLFQWDAKTAAEVNRKRVREMNKGIDHYIRTGQLPEEAEDATAAPPAPSAPAAPAGGGLPAGWSVTPVQ